MGNNKTVTLIDGYKEIGEVDVICSFEVPELEGKYIIYNKKEHDEEGNSIIYIAKIVTLDNKQFIENVQEGEEWNKLKEIMKSMSKHSLEGEKNV